MILLIIILHLEIFIQFINFAEENNIDLKNL